MVTVTEIEFFINQHFVAKESVLITRECYWAVRKEWEDRMIVRVPIACLIGTFEEITAKAVYPAHVGEIGYPILAGITRICALLKVGKDNKVTVIHVPGTECFTRMKVGLCNLPNWGCIHY
jgi:hypothetical protein